MTASMKLSVPEYHRRPPRQLEKSEREAFERVADALIAPSELAGFPDWLDRALAARSEAFLTAVALAQRFACTPTEELLGELKRFSVADPDGFHLLSSVVAGAYLMIPEVRRTIGYPGQRRHHAQFDEAANQIMDGILDPVVARGPIYTPVPAPRV
jgi:hypothetical protein